jgi:hypothetical protein
MTDVKCGEKFNLLELQRVQNSAREAKRFENLVFILLSHFVSFILELNCLIQKILLHI